MHRNYIYIPCLLLYVFRKNTKTPILSRALDNRIIVDLVLVLYIFLQYSSFLQEACKMQVILISEIFNIVKFISNLSKL